MPRIRNSFKIRAADSPILETSQFLQLYCPVLLNQLQQDELLVPKLIVVKGTPGSGKSSLLRLFETDTLVALHARRSQPTCQPLVERLEELGILAESGPRVIGIYIQCDSGLRDVANLGFDSETAGLFNSLLDVRIVSAFVRGLTKLTVDGGLEVSLDAVFEPLSQDQALPALFAEPRSVRELGALCTNVERDFGALLNSFPEDPLPPTIQPHSRVYALGYLAAQRERIEQLAGILPVVMLDDVQELYPEQRTHLEREFVRRSAIPRWLATRTQVFGLEKLISLEGAESGRDFQELDLDKIFREKPGVFTRFATNVVDRRLGNTEALRPIDVEGFTDLLKPSDDVVREREVEAAIRQIEARTVELSRGTGSVNAKRVNELAAEIRREAATNSVIGTQQLVSLEESLILLERQANKGQRALFPGLEAPESADAKTQDAATLFLSRRLGIPYYFGFDVLVSLASHNVQQLLSILASIVDRMIYRADLGREKALSPKQQEEILKRTADEYYDGLEEKHRAGGAIKQLVDNLGRFSNEVTYRPNAPIAPGVNGFGVTPAQLKRAVSEDPDAVLLRNVLTNAVAGNVLSVRPTKQGQAGSEKIVFYLNRILCIKYQLPLSYGGWQALSTRSLARMMKTPVAPKDVRRRLDASGELLDDKE